MCTPRIGTRSSTISFRPIIQHPTRSQDRARRIKTRTSQKTYLNGMPGSKRSWQSGTRASSDPEVFVFIPHLYQLRLRHTGQQPACRHQPPFQCLHSRTNLLNPTNRFIEGVTEVVTKSTTTAPTLSLRPRPHLRPHPHLPSPLSLPRTSKASHSLISAKPSTASASPLPQPRLKSSNRPFANSAQTSVLSATLYRAPSVKRGFMHTNARSKRNSDLSSTSSKRRGDPRRRPGRPNVNAVELSGGLRSVVARIVSEDKNWR